MGTGPVHKWLLDAIMVVGDEDRSPATASFDESSLAEADQDDEKYKVERSKGELVTLSKGRPASLGEGII